MRLGVLAFTFLVCAHAQQLEFLNQKAGGKVARDTQGNWIFAERAGDDIRIRKLSADLAQTIFDVTTGGSATEDVTRLQVDAAGNAFVIGRTGSNDFPMTAGALPLPASGVAGSFFLRVDPAGNIATSAYLESQVSDFVAAQDGDWIVAGQAYGLAGGTLLLQRIDHDGTVLRSRRLVDIGVQPTVTALRTDPAGNLFVAGSTGADNFPVTPGAFGPRRLSGVCFGPGFFAPPFPCPAGFVMKLDGADLHVIAATYLGGKRAATLSALAVDAEGYPYVTGNLVKFLPAEDAYPVTPGAFQTAYSGSNAFSYVPFVTRLAPDLSALKYSTYLSGTFSETTTAIAVDGAGRAIVSGGTTSRDFPATGAFQKPCGPRDPNFPIVGFVTRLAADGSSVESSAMLDANANIQFTEGGDPVATASNDLVRVRMAPANGPVASCTINGGSFRRESFLAPGQLVTVMGGPFPEQARLLFDGVAAPLLYTGPAQINAVVPQSVAGRTATTMELEVDGARTNARRFDVRGANPTVLIWIAPDGNVDNRGNLLANVALSDGTTNTEENPAHIGEVVTVFTTGLDLSQPITLHLNFSEAPVLAVKTLPDSFGSVVGIDVRIPGPAGGMYVVGIKNGDAQTALNPGFIWTQ